MGKGSWFNWRSKCKSIKWPKFGSERLLAAANSDEREELGKRATRPSRAQSRDRVPHRLQRPLRQIGDCLVFSHY